MNDTSDSVHACMQVVEASMTSAMNDEEGEDDMHCGNETLAAFMLHHCMHVNLNGYSKISPFRHASNLPLQYLTFT